MEFLESVFFFVVTLGVLVFVHELGHFLAAKIFGMRVDRFSIGFPPRAFGRTIGDTDYCISWIPIGGYVKIAGMIDESFDTDHLQHAPQPWEYRSKPIWQRMIVISAGVIMNVFLAIAIFWGINFVQGRDIRETTEVGFIASGSPAEQAGLKTGDRILEINGNVITHWDEIFNQVYLESGVHDLSFVVMRGGARTDLFIARASVPDPSEASFGIVPTGTEVIITSVESGKPADKLGLKVSDVLIALNETPVKFNQKVVEIVRGNAGQPISIEWRRGNEMLRGVIVPTDDGRIGIGMEPRYTGPVRKIRYSLFEAFPAGVRDIVKITSLSFQQIWLMITGDVAFSKNVGGPIKIAQMATATAEYGLISYLGFMALLSISLAILNILPFPALDGGHLLFLVYEGIFRREIPVNVKMGLQRAGFVLLITFMAFVVYNDIMNF